MDCVGTGALPDVHFYNDVGANTIGNIVRKIPDLDLPNLAAPRLGNIDSEINIRPYKKAMNNQIVKFIFP